MLKKLIIKEKIMAMTYGGIMYFPLNVNFFEDAPIELIEAKFGLVGEAAVMKLLCKMYKEKGILPVVGRRAMHALLTQNGN